MTLTNHQNDLGAIPSFAAFQTLLGRRFAMATQSDSASAEALKTQVTLAALENLSLDASTETFSLSFASDAGNEVFPQAVYRFTGVDDGLDPFHVDLFTVPVSFSERGVATYECIVNRMRSASER